MDDETRQALARIEKIVTEIASVVFVFAGAGAGYVTYRMLLPANGQLWAVIGGVVVGVALVVWMHRELAKRRSG